jgi:hypothetical protein
MVLLTPPSPPLLLLQIEHLQTALSPIANRLIPLSAGDASGSLFDQCCRVRMESFGTRHQEEEEEEQRHERDRRNTDTEPKPPIRRIHSMVEELISEDEEDGDNLSSVLGDDTQDPAGEPEPEPDLRLESFVAKVSVGIPVGSYYLNRKVMSIVSRAADL